jgi:Ca-activated chloride channel family protein
LEQGLAVLAGGKPAAPRALIVFSDGEATAEAEMLSEVLEQADRQRVRVYTVGLGTAAGARIPVPRSERERIQSAASGGGPGVEGEAWLRDREGREVTTRLNETLLREVSRATGGVYVPATREGLEVLLRRLDAQDARHLGRAGIPVNILLLLAFGCLFAEGFLFRRA